ncbi:MAG: T9SS type A sorting domain-containing protein, partial [Bacteroidia bacterium]|nr:T9SS type A sorting domain-containing protein [Bacteroidia bacterium]
GATGNPKILVAAESVTHSDGLSGLSEPWSFNWTAPATDEGTITFYTAVVAGNGGQGTNGDQVALTSEAYDLTTLSLVENESSGTKIWPNPAGEFINIGLPQSRSEGLIEVFNLNGQLVMEESFNSSQTILNIGSLAKGLYLIRTTATDYVSISKIIKQ